MIHNPEVPSVLRIIHCVQITTQQSERLVCVTIRQWKLRAFWCRTNALFSDGVPSDDIHVIIKRWKIFMSNLTIKTFHYALANNGNKHFQYSKVGYIPDELYILAAFQSAHHHTSYPSTPFWPTTAAYSDRSESATVQSQVKLFYTYWKGVSKTFLPLNKVILTR